MNYHIIPSGSILELVRELTIGQRSTNTPERLSAFLHNNIFPKVGVFATEIYYADSHSREFHPISFNGRRARPGKRVPGKIGGREPIIRRLAQSGLPLEFEGQPVSVDFLDETGNRSHLLVPVLDGRNLSALIYFGNQSTCSFTSDFLISVQTLAAVIGSRLKSMAIIQQLTESMRAQEYSERLKAALYEISEQAHYSLDLNDLYAELHRIVGNLIHAPNFFIALAENRKDGEYITFPYYADEYDSHFQGMDLRLNPERYSITGHLLNTRQPLLLTPQNFHQVCRDHNIECVGTPAHSWLGAPFYMDHIKGAVAVQSYNRVIYTERDKKLMAFVARHIGDALNRKRAVDELRIAKERAEQAEKNKSIFLANMSHEIRTPMNGILGLTDLLLNEGLSGQQQTYLEMVYSSADRLLKLINDILDFSKIEAGKLMLNINSFSLRKTIAVPIEILAISAVEKNIALTVDCDEHIPDLLLGDADKLSQILINLLSNGVKFTERGKVQLSVLQEGSAQKESGHVNLLFQVRDTGIGIPPENIDQVFEAFSQLGTTQNSNHRGSGLGLVIAAELVDMMGGQICVESKTGAGTCFFFTLRFPLSKGGVPVQPERENGRRTAVHPTILPHPLHILLVEDEYINRTLAVTVLAREGWKVDVAENGLQALDLLQKNSFDLVLMDIQMPEMDGYETTRRIRRREERTGTRLPVIAMTAYAVKGDQEKCLAAGMDGYIPKPIRPDQLRHEIENVLQNHPLGQSKDATG
jgi:signal transduction histidine kinase/CheY-like chemotaxis protein